MLHQLKEVLLVLKIKKIKLKFSKVQQQAKKIHRKEEENLKETRMY